MRIIILFFAFFLIAAPLSAETNTVLQTNAEHAQNLLDKTFSRMGHAWEQMKLHFSKGNQLLKESAKKTTQDTMKKGKRAVKKIPGVGK